MRAREERNRNVSHVYETVPVSMCCSLFGGHLQGVYSALQQIAVRCSALRDEVKLTQLLRAIFC